MKQKFLLGTVLPILCILLTCMIPTAALTADPDASTLAVDASVSLPDGTYYPDSFAFSGGTGKVKITCPELTVQDGTAYATLCFSSSSYTYIKASGMIDYAELKDGKAYFRIPVVLNQNNRILGMTTKMSTPHEIEYTIFISLSRRTVNDDSLDSSAPDIQGLMAVQGDSLTHSQLLKVFRYQDGVSLVEIDTERQPEQQDIIPEEELTQADYIAALYRRRVLKYLVVPENYTLPAGLEKQFIIIQLPADSIYAADTCTVDALAELGTENRITAVGIDDDRFAFGGPSNSPDYRALLLNKVRIAIAGDAILDTLSGDTADWFSALDIPLIVDRSGVDTVDHFEDWMTLYQIILEQET